MRADHGALAIAKTPVPAFPSARGAVPPSDGVLSHRALPGLLRQPVAMNVSATVRGRGCRRRAGSGGDTGHPEPGPAHLHDRKARPDRGATVPGLIMLLVALLHLGLGANRMVLLALTVAIGP